jgi:hypothetical protein
MKLDTIAKILILCSAGLVNHQFFVIARREVNRRRRADRRGNPGKNLPQALTIYNAYLFFIWIATLHDSASGLNHSARNDGKPNVFNIYKIKTIG